MFWFFVNEVFNMDYISDNDELYFGFLGENVTLPCDGFSPNQESHAYAVEWETSSNNSSEWVEAAILYLKQHSTHIIRYSEQFAGRADLSSLNGALTILDFQREDEGLYKCALKGNSTAVHLKLYGELDIWIMCIIRKAKVFLYQIAYLNPYFIRQELFRSGF